MKILIDDKIQAYAPEQIAQWTAELPEWRREQVLAYKHDLGQRQSLLAYRLLCQGLREEYGITEPPTFTYGEHGKPYIPTLSPALSHYGEGVISKVVDTQVPPPSRGEVGRRVHFSLSHCKEAVACVIDNQPCGIDIESVNRRASESLIHYAMNEEEQELIQRQQASGEQEGKRTFIRLWTQKEAVLKLIGTGIRDDMKDVLTKDEYNITTQETELWVMSVATCKP